MLGQNRNADLGRDDDRPTTSPTPTPSACCRAPTSPSGLASLLQGAGRGHRADPGDLPRQPPGPGARRRRRAGAARRRRAAGGAASCRAQQRPDRPARHRRRQRGDSVQYTGVGAHARAR
ncbi:MAG: hypothetical protein MZW92_74855 [Comamonadaceae bacterium]|nr:hypothetical protein [Comamonadaceae bacterium]